MSSAYTTLVLSRAYCLLFLLPIFGTTGGAAILPLAHSDLIYSLHSSFVPSGWSSCHSTTLCSRTDVIGPGLMPSSLIVSMPYSQIRQLSRIIGSEESRVTYIQPGLFESARIQLKLLYTTDQPRISLNSIVTGIYSNYI